MNIKDLSKLMLFIDKGAKNVVLARVAPNGEITNLQRPITDNFLECMLHYLLTKSDGSIKPVVIKKNGEPVFEITIKPIEPAAAPSTSPILRPV